MRDVTQDNFGLLIAYVIPGLIVVWAVGGLSPIVAGWLGAAENAPTVGGFLYVTVTSVASGMLVSALRWLLIDSLHHATGIARPSWDFGRLQEHISAFLTVVDHQYRHYQFYSNSLVGLIIAYALRRFSTGSAPWDVPHETAVFALLSAVCFIASRDNLRKYYARTNQILRRSRSGRRALTSR